jgi:ABC-type branched-subunit amino acid transport system substrate-binding protein
MQPLHSIFTTLLFLIFLTTTVNGEELRLGTTLSLTGPYATYGRQALQGIQKAIAEKNSAGGVNGKEVKLFVEDFGTLDLRAALSGARKLIDIEKVDVFLPLIVEDSEVIVPITSQKPLFSMVVGCGSRKCGFNLGPYNVRASSSHDEIINLKSTQSGI